MELPTTMQGRPFGPEQLAQVQDLITQGSGWSRWRLSRGLVVNWPGLGIGAPLRASPKTWPRGRSCSNSISRAVSSYRPGGGNPRLVRAGHLNALIQSWNTAP